MTPNNWFLLASFAALLLSASLQLLAAIGHFPKESRVAELKSSRGALILHGSIFVTLLAVALGIAIAAVSLPWYAAIIGGGIAVLVAPLMLPNFSDRFVDGRPALLVFALCTVAALGAMGLLR